MFAELIDPITRREREVLRLIYKGYSNANIADDLGITEGTVKTHVRAILGKFGAKDRGVLAALRIDNLESCINTMACSLQDLLDENELLATKIRSLEATPRTVSKSPKYPKVS